MGKGYRAVPDAVKVKVGITHKVARLRRVSKAIGILRDIVIAVADPVLFQIIKRFQDVRIGLKRLRIFAEPDPVADLPVVGWGFGLPRPLRRLRRGDKRADPG